MTSVDSLQACCKQSSRKCEFSFSVFSFRCVYKEKKKVNIIEMNRNILSEIR